jgi:hypothetical protein
MTHNGPSATPHQRTLGHGPVANAHAGRALLRAAALRTNLSIWFRSNKDGKPRMEQKTKVNSVPADPTKWSEQSQRSISFHYIREYNDITYNCWRCARSAIFSASDQLYTYEVKKGTHRSAPNTLHGFAGKNRCASSKISSHASGAGLTQSLC